MTNLAVMLGSAPNRDFPPDMQGPAISPHMVGVETLDQAQAACLAFIREHDLGGGNWIGGRVHADGGAGALVARVHYNGRVEIADATITEDRVTNHGWR